jgi:hypothetical protein
VPTLKPQVAIHFNHDNLFQSCLLTHLPQGGQAPRRARASEAGSVHDNYQKCRRPNIEIAHYRKKSFLVNPLSKPHLRRDLKHPDEPEPVKPPKLGSVQDKRQKSRQAMVYVHLQALEHHNVSTLSGAPFMILKTSSSCSVHLLRCSGNCGCLNPYGDGSANFRKCPKDAILSSGVLEAFFL